MDGVQKRMKIEFTKTSDGGYEDDGIGVTSVGGDMVEFDMNPERSSWSDRSTDYRPGKGAPTAEGGRAEYNTGKKESIGMNICAVMRTSSTKV